MGSHLDCDPELLTKFKALEAKQLEYQATIRKEAKRKRGWHRILSGTWKHRNEKLYRLDLTIDKAYEPKLAQFWQTLRKRGLREFNYVLNYVSVKAKGDKGGKLHLHILYCVSHPSKYKGVAGTPYGEKLAWIPKSWITKNWYEISGGSYVNYIQTVKDRHRSPKRIAGYMISQYFSGQNNYERMSYSWHWGFKGMARTWNDEYAPFYKINPSDCIDSWHSLLDQTTLLEVAGNG